MHTSVAPGQQSVPGNSGLAAQRMSRDAGTGGEVQEIVWFEVIGGGEAPAL